MFGVMVLVFPSHCHVCCSPAFSQLAEHQPDHEKQQIILYFALLAFMAFVLSSKPIDCPYLDLRVSDFHSSNSPPNPAGGND